MRCKRCGEILNPGDTRCPVCGKIQTQTPPRRRPPTQKNAENNIKLPQLDRFTHTYHQDAARSRTLQTVTIIAVAAVLVLLILVYTGMGDLKSAVGQLQKDAQDILQGQQVQPVVPEDPTEGTTEAPTTNEDGQILPLAQRNVEVELTVRRSDSGTYALADMDLGNPEERPAVWVSTSEGHPDRRISVSWILPGDRLDVVLSDCHSGAEGSYTAGLNWVLAGDTFGGYSNAMCIWEYRIDGGAWESLPVETITAVPGGCEVRLSAEDLTTLQGTGAGMEIRCSLSMTHADGGRLKLTVTGLVLNTEGLTVSGLAD